MVLISVSLLAFWRKGAGCCIFTFVIWENNTCIFVEFFCDKVFLPSGSFVSKCPILDRTEAFGVLWHEGFFQLPIVLQCMVVGCILDIAKVDI